jgi:1,4-dihydroxy-2-naphthoyl-CoA hydrolase
MKLMLCNFFMAYHRTVHLGDTDAAGVIYFAKLLSICHEAYEFELQEHGINLRDFLCSSKTAIPIVHAEIDFLKPLFCRDKVEVVALPTLVNQNRFVVDYQVYLFAQRQQLIARSKTIHLCIDIMTREKHPLPEPWLTWIASN